MRKLSKVLLNAMLLLAYSVPVRAENLTYAYDALGRLVGTVSVVSSANIATSIYSYDKANNRSVVWVAKADGIKRPVFRFFTVARGHFYTIGFMEGHAGGLGAEGPTFNLYVSGGTGRQALYRCYNASSVDDFISTSSSCEGQTVNSILGYASTASGTGLTQLHRCYRTSDMDHLITKNMSECTNYGYTYEMSLGYVP
ncbi:hypothetical protein [Sphingobium sp. Leaf26]|uniref:hypothetical protein n=1 Tax=Sphingobium sp. Leaf26 TaxID=1735693 RepID=UPI000A61A818|nr:hypothetical protein [Sphingobium sp. Leaf26]